MFQRRMTNHEGASRITRELTDHKLSVRDLVVKHQRSGCNDVAAVDSGTVFLDQAFQQFSCPQRIADSVRARFAIGS